MSGALIIACVAILVILWLVSAGKDTTAPTRAKPARRKAAQIPDQDDAADVKRRYLAEAAVWMQPRWGRATQKQHDEDNSEFRPWYYEDPTERQLKLINDLGLSKMANGVTKGQASDLIGLFERPDSDELEILKFFKISSRGMSQTKARDEIGKLFSSGENRTAWEQRPPTVMQKEFYRFFGLPVPKGLTLYQMQSDIDEKLEEMGDEEADEWGDFDCLYDDLIDADSREDYEIKKVSLKVFRDYILGKKAGGVKVSDLEVSGVAEELVEMHPELHREIY